MKQYIYIMSNDSLPGMVKIGLSICESPERRRCELSASSSIPTPFKIEGSFIVENVQKVEKRIHHTLNKYRVSSSREFFLLKPELACKFVGNIINGTHSDDSIKEIEKAKKVSNTDDIAKFLKKTRKAQDITQETLASFSNVSNRFIIDLERGKQTCQIEKALITLNTLGIEIYLKNR